MKRSHRMHPRPQEDYSLAEQEERALKRPRLIEGRPERDQAGTSSQKEQTAVIY